VDLIEELESEHTPLTEGVAHLRDLVDRVESGGAAPAEIRDAFALGLAELREQLLEHFGREEECFFPFFENALPTIRSEVQSLEAAHDQICGSLTRLVHLASREGRSFAETFAHVAHVFRRFEATYAEHARNERGVLRRASAELSEAQREALAREAEGLL
jgi:iron-sulfur cluster repair protein YtfE (RIC family)